MGNTDPYPEPGEVSVKEFTTPLITAVILPPEPLSIAWTFAPDPPPIG